MDEMKNRYQAVIFDMDGTMLDTLDDIADSMNRALAGLGFPLHRVEHYRNLVGDGIEVLAMRALPEDHRSARDIEAGVQAMRKEYSTHWAEKSRPFPGITDMLDGLAGRGIKLSILSNKIDAFAKAMADALLPNWRFIEVRGLLPDIPRKPDPTGALICADRMGVEPERCVLVGDSDIDMETARRAGMDGFGALWGYQDRERLLACGAKVLLGHPTDLLRYFHDKQTD